MAGRETISIAGSLVESAVKERGVARGVSNENGERGRGWMDGRKESSRTSTARWYRQQPELWSHNILLWLDPPRNFLRLPFFPLLDAPFLSTFLSPLPPFSFFSRGEHLFTIHSTSNLPAMTFPSLVLSSLDPKVPATTSLSLSLSCINLPYLNDNLCSFFVILYTRERRCSILSLASLVDESRAK